MDWYKMGNNIFNEILDDNNITKDEIYAFINICAYLQGKSPKKKICAVTPGNNLTYLSTTSQLTGGSHAFFNHWDEAIEDLRERFKIQPNTPMVVVLFNYHIPYIVYTQSVLE